MPAVGMNPEERCITGFIELSFYSFVALIIWACLGLQNSMPKCYLQDFYVPALDKNLYPIPTSNATNIISFDLKLENVMWANGIHYDTINLTFSYGRNPSLPISRYQVPPFHQGIHKTAHRRDVFKSHGVPWEDAYQSLLNGSTAVFSVDLATTVKFKKYFAYRRSKSLVLRANLEIDSSGRIVQRKTIKLKSLPKLVMSEAAGLFVSSF